MRTRKEAHGACGGDFLQAFTCMRRMICRRHGWITAADVSGDAAADVMVDASFRTEPDALRGQSERRTGLMPAGAPMLEC